MYFKIFKLINNFANPERRIRLTFRYLKEAFVLYLMTVQELEEIKVDHAEGLSDGAIKLLEDIIMLKQVEEIPYF